MAPAADPVPASTPARSRRGLKASRSGADSNRTAMRAVSASRTMLKTIWNASPSYQGCVVTQRVMTRTTAALNTPTMTATRVITAFFSYCAQAVTAAAIMVQNKLDPIVSGASASGETPVWW